MLKEKGGSTKAGSAKPEAVKVPKFENGQQAPDQTSGLVQRMLASPGPAAGGQSAPTTAIIPLDQLLNQLGISTMAEGGTLPAGQPAVVGEAGPEVVQSATQDMNIAPIPIERENLLKKIAVVVGTSLSKNPMAMAAARRNQAEALAAQAAQNPLLLNNPQIAGKVAEIFGDDVVQQLARSADPEYKAAVQARAMNLPIVAPGTPQPDGTAAPSRSTQLASQAQARGMGVQTDNSGKLRITVPALQRTEADSLKAFSLFEQFRQGLEDNGVTGSAADIGAAQSVQRMAGQFGLLMPKELQKLAFARTEQDIAAAKTAVTERIKQQTKLDYAAAQNSAASQGKVYGEALGRLNTANQQVEINMPDPLAPNGMRQLTIPLSSVKDATTPITDADKLMGWVMPDGTYPPPGTSNAQLMAAGAVPVSKETRQAALKLRGIDQIVTDMKTVAENLFPDDDLAARSQRYARYVYDRNFEKKNPDIATLATLNARFGQLVAALGGESAAKLSDADVTRMINGFSFGLFESKTSSRKKIEVIERGIAALREGITSGRLVAEIDALGGDAKAVADQLGVGGELKARADAAAERRNTNKKSRQTTVVIGGQPALVEIED